MVRRIIYTFLLCLFGSVSLANAALFDVEFYDYDGPHWTGQINTTTDTLTINTWVESNGYLVYWAPTSASLPMVWDAVDGTGSTYDIPDDWNGNFGTNWGFLSPVVLSDMSFNEGTCTISNMKTGWHMKEIDGVIYTNSGTDKVTLWPRYSNFTQASVADELYIIPVVPIPGAVWLFGSGLIGLIGFRKKLKK